MLGGEIHFIGNKLLAAITGQLVKIGHLQGILGTDLYTEPAIYATRQINLILF